MDDANGNVKKEWEQRNTLPVASIARFIGFSKRRRCGDFISAWRDGMQFYFVSL
jgi:hypothetical protein